MIYIRLFHATLLLIILTTISYGQSNPFENPCPYSATGRGDGTGLLSFYSSNMPRIKSTGSEINKAVNNDWGYVLLKNDKVPAMDKKGYLHYDTPFDIAYLLYYKSDKEIQKTWWGHSYNKPKNETVTFRSQYLIEQYKKQFKVDINFFDDIKYELSLKKFIVAEYSSSIKNKADILVTNMLFVKTGIIKDKSDYTTLMKFYNDFFLKFENLIDENWENRVFITTVKGKSSNYIANFRVQNQKLVGELLTINATTNPSIIAGIDKEFATLKSDGIAYVYGDNLFDLGKKITETASRKNILLISRNTSINKTFTETEKAIANLRNKKLDSKTLSFINGTPATIDEATFQSFDNSDIQLLQKLKGEVDLKAAAKTSKILTTKEGLLEEIANGNNDVLFIVAHCDEKNIYFGKEKVSIDELSNRPSRVKRDNERVAILFSCLSGKLFDKRKPFLPFFKKNLQSFSEVLIEKNFFDLIISPPTTINGAEVLKMIDILNEYDILELRNYFNKLLVNGEMYNIVKR